MAHGDNGAAHPLSVSSSPAPWPALLWLLVGVAAGAVAGVVVALARPRARFDETAVVGGLAKKLVEKIATTPHGISHDAFIESFVAILVLFCASGAGIFGALLVLALGKWMAARYAASKAERQDASPV